MNEIIIEASNKPLLIKEYQGQRVVTLKDIDEQHKRADGTAHRNFKANRKRFVESEDYFHLSFEESRGTNFVQRPNPNGLILLTEMGYLMLVKSFTDDLAWNVQRQLVNTYFRVQDQQQLPTPAPDTLTDRLDRLITLLEQQYTQPQPLMIEAAPEPEPPKGKYNIRELQSKKLLTTNEACFILGISVVTFNDIMKSDNFYPLMRIGHNRGRVFINREKLDQWINEQDSSYKMLEGRCR